MRVLVANSTQQRHPTGGDPWVRSTLRAVETLAGEGCSFVASCGTTPWEIALWRAASCGAPVHVIAPAPRGEPEGSTLVRLTNEFGLCPARTTWQLLPSARATGRGKDTWSARDRAAFDAADVVCPISIRPGGRLEALLGAHPGRVDDRFRVPFVRRQGESKGWSLPRDGFEDLEWPGPSLLHLTRASEGPWPGEAAHEFLRDLTRSSDRYPRSGFETLCRILLERRIRASGFRIRKGAATVSFTALAPSQAVTLLRWRSRYARYSFEPYGVWISLEAARRIGAQPVRYDEGAAPDRQDCLRQGRGARGHWEAEQEWRVEGDVALSGLGAGEVGAIVASDEEAEELRDRIAGLTVASFGGGGGKGLSRRESRR